MPHKYLSGLETEEEKNALAQIYEELKGLCYNIAFRITKNNAMSEDAVHEAFVKVIKNKNTFFNLHAKQRVAYITRAVKNKALDLITLRDENAKSDLRDITEISDNVDLCKIIETQEAYDEVVKAIKSLPEKYKAVLEMRYVNDMRNCEIAEELGISGKAVSKHAIKAIFLVCDRLTE
ncbi:MAG: sigma-70 family RNA polymerase sigma factor [Defluviitaleaceae bacterium]|nr:sigma-70 family RNA polymerase sigma factor [Defluviitaleaceae bacterium]